jgi:hypothetical protein
MYRTQILLHLTQHEVLTEIARRERRSVSDVVREMIQLQLERRQKDAEAEVKKHLFGLDQVRRNREEMLRRRGGQEIDFDVVEAIRQLREERDVRNLGRLDDRR